MVTLAEVKAFLRISDTDATRDALISMLIPIVYQDMVDECNYAFKVDDYDLTDDAIYFDVTGTTYTINLAAGGFTAMKWPTGGTLVVSGSRLNDGIYTIASQSDTAITLTEPVVDETQPTDAYSVTLSLVNYPKQFELIASMMIGEQLDNPSGAEIISQKIGNYSETRAQKQSSTASGYSNRVMGMLAKFKRVRVGKGSIVEHANENRTYFPIEPSASEVS
jgi:Phage gp6-like head-tail connector protein